MKRTYNILAAAAAICCFVTFSAWADYDPDLKARIIRGLDGIYSLNLENARREFEEIITVFPGQPYGYYGRAMTTWARFEYEFDESNPEMDRLFQKQTDEAIEKGEQWLEKYPDDPHAHLCVGGMYGLRSRLALSKHNWIRAYWDGSKGLKHMRRAIKLAPDFYDPYLGLGMYEYYAGTLSGVIKVLAALFLHGDPEKGIQYLTLAKDKAMFTQVAAELVLVEIYTQTGSKFENPKLALEMVRELRAKYPGHPLLHYVEIITLFENGKYDLVEKESLNYIKCIEENKPFYFKTYLPRAYVGLGMSYFARHDWEAAAKCFRTAGDMVTDKQSANRWALWALVRLAQVYDLEGKRELAVKTYRQALSVTDHWGFRDYIVDFLSKPYLLAAVPGQLPPP